MKLLEELVSILVGGLLGGTVGSMVVITIYHWLWGRKK